jgi:hypothetical protein
MLKYARRNSPEINRRYGTTASYLDVHTCVAPWHHVDFEPDEELAGTYAAKVKHHAELFRFEREVHGGPLFGEGARHFFWAGLVDGVEAQVEGGEDAPVLVDFDLLKLHPQMVNHGMGYYSRWLAGGRSAARTDWQTPRNLDRYRAQELAYGHAAFVGSGLLRIMPAVFREYNLVQPVQALYGNAKATQIMYEVDGRFVTSSVAAAVGVLDRLRVRYDSGLTLHVNLGEDDWRVRDHVLPAYGFLAEAPGRGTLAYTSRRGGAIADFARTPRSLYADARTHVYEPWAYGRKDVEPRVRSFRHLGGGRCEITYEWTVEDELPDGLKCFVHFTPTAGAERGEIAFQGDHALAPDTSAWREGAVVADGPHAVTVPAEAAHESYDVLVGLWKTDRVKLRGIPAGSNRYAVGRLRVRREGGRVVGVALEGVDDLRRELEEARAAFRERMNVEGRAVEFGCARTDGAFRAHLSADGIVVIPFPRDEEFEVALEPATLAPRLARARLRVAALAADGRELGEVASRAERGRLTFRAGRAGAAKFVIRRLAEAGR